MLNKCYVKKDKQNKFVSFFNPENGFYLRSGIYKDGVETEKDPFMGSFPELLDVGIMGRCHFGQSGLCLQSGVECYQSGLTKHQENMSLDNFKKIVDESKGKVFQIALGGRGDPDQHEDFEEILKYCRENHIVPNFTSSGLGFNDKIVSLCKEHCGAIAISEYRSIYTQKAINMLLEAGVTTNVHYVLSNNSIDEAITRLLGNDFSEGINAVIFLLHKPVGLGSENNVLKYNDPKVKEFFNIIDTVKFPFAIGFDSCSIPGIINLTKEINRFSIDTCEGGRFSAYISSDMIMLPCSFDQDYKWGYDISNDTIQNAWNSKQFDDFRNCLFNSCIGCVDREFCFGGCPIVPEIVLCERKI